MAVPLARLEAGAGLGGHDAPRRLAYSAKQTRPLRSTSMDARSPSMSSAVASSFPATVLPTPRDSKKRTSFPSPGLGGANEGGERGTADGQRGSRVTSRPRYVPR